MQTKKKLADSARAYYARNRERIILQVRHRRRTDVVGSIVTDTRKDDRKKSRANELDREFVAELINNPCSYCGDSDLRKTVDRIDNSLGHLRSNVVCACERCNYVRRNMPYDAWLVLAVAMREARERGLFGTWTGAIHRRGELGPIPDPPPRPSPPHGTIARYHTCGPPTCDECRAAMASWKRHRRKQQRQSGP
jgi:hypothetical protein